MNQFAIFCSLALFYISSTPVQAANDKIVIKKATMSGRLRGGPKEFKQGVVYLDKVDSSTNAGDRELNFYEIRDDTRQDCMFFPLGQFNTMVFSDRLIIKNSSTTIVLYPKDGETPFYFYQSVFNPRPYPKSYDITNVYLDDKPLEGGVNAVKTKRVEYGKRYYAFFQGNDLRLVIPKDCVQLTKKKAPEVKVRVTVEENLALIAKVIDIEFDSAANANAFYTDFKKV